MFQIEFDAQEIEGALPDYRYINRLGSGTFAIVHLVADRKTNQQMALKKICCFGMGQYEKAGAANQVRILGSLDHKNIIKINSCLFDNNEDIIYIFMEYASSGDLTNLIQQAKQKKKRIPQTTIWKAISDIADGLDYLHKNSIIHRDLKPANIFRTERNFKIGDMNVSKIVKNGSLATTKTGSPLYTAPEVWQNQPYNQKCDVWSLGVLIYQLCSLKVPYEAMSIDELTRKIKNTKPKTIPNIYSCEMQELIRKMLQQNPKKRISAQQVHKIAQEKLRTEMQFGTQKSVENLMDTIVFPDTHQRWVNLIPLPPKISRKQSMGSSSIKKEKSKERSRQKSMERSREKSRQRSKQNRKNTQVFQQNNSNIFSSSQEKRRKMLPKSKSKHQQNISMNRIPRVKLPSIHKRNSSQQSQRKRTQQPQSHRQIHRQVTQNREHSSSARINRKMVQRYMRSAKKLINVQNEYHD